MNKNHNNKHLSTVSIVIVNWNGKSVLIDCIDSVLNLKYPIQEIIVVDNGSTDNSIEIVKNKYDNNIVIIQNQKNLGAPVARNQGMKYALKSGVDYIFCLDNDLTVDENAIEKLIEVMIRNEKIAMVGALIFHHEQPDVIFSAGA